ncbi:Trans-aconitate 2-methyltransferase [Pseudovibrio axinellae]|uniref:Trans-aconitate 2-methyltransferase n=1 Tax=Pseudovibrio axinellae TaxID=989403 RepID=A0A161XCT8_9HYPH|nr:class I SAM-dependent methyltransferase [Pseudovibrio axinellae]KZL09461.1 Trans-aconitate 2-methyltransferase [Pseudovibrio axinellae]SEQ64163.1 Methyltransferase domain-containing protein [Pseudovibrio axinellae]
MKPKDVAASHFQTAGGAYAKYRPTYPAELATFLALQCRQHNTALDLGCGTGQFSKLIANHFKQVLATDVSASQIDNAVPASNIRFAVEPAEQCSADDGSVDLIVAAQAAHWFDLARFYEEVERIAAPGAVLALVSYGVLAIDEAKCNERFGKFYYDEIGPYWPPERKHVDNGYASFEFPFQAIKYPSLSIERNWTLEQFLGYVGTWSSIRAATKAGEGAILGEFSKELASLWGDPNQQTKITWPIAKRLGRV